MNKLILVSITVSLLVGLGLPQAMPKPHKHFVLRGVSQQRPVKPPSPAFQIDRAQRSPVQAKSKGDITLANLSIENRTDYNCYVYLDDLYVGSVGPYGKSRNWLTHGYHELVIVSAEGTVKWTLKRVVEDGETIDVILN